MSKEARPKEAPLVSIIIPCYNCEKYVKKCIDSVTAQTYENVEVIFVDDGSTDNTPDILRKLNHTNKCNITVITENNSGVSEARNNGIKHANGKYIMFVDSDDYVDKEIVKKMVELAESSNADITKCNRSDEYVEDEVTDIKVKPVWDKVTTIEKKDFSSKIYPQFFGRCRLCNAYLTLIRKSLIDRNRIGFRKDLKVDEDEIFMMELFDAATVFSYTPEALYFYVKNTNGLSSGGVNIYDRADSREKHVKILQEYAEKWKVAEKTKQIIEKRSFLAIYTAIQTAGKNARYTAKERYALFKKILANRTNRTAIKKSSKSAMILPERIICTLAKCRLYRTCFILSSIFESIKRNNRSAIEKKRILNKKQNDDSSLAKIIFWSFLSQLLFTITKRLLPANTLGTSIAAMVSFPYFAYLLIMALKHGLYKINKKTVIALILVTILYAVSFLARTPINKIAVYYPQTIFGICLLSIAFRIKNPKALYDEFMRSSYILTIVSALIIFVDKNTYVYSMHYSYILSLALYFQIIDLFKYRTKKSIILSLISLILIVLYGSRGPLLCLGVFLVLYILIYQKNKYIKIGFITASLIAFICINPVLQLVNNATHSIGIHSRTIDLLVNDIGHMSGRGELVDKSISLIKNNPFSGYGIAGEFRYMNQYPHNILIELLVHWGIIIGTLLFMLLAILLVHSIIISKEHTLLLLIVLICYGFIILLFSGSYLSWDGFYILLGVAARAIINKGNHEQKSHNKA